MPKAKAPTTRAVPVVTPTTTLRETTTGAKKRLTVWLPVELAEALREVAHEEWRARPEPRGRIDATDILERALRADPAMADWLGRTKLLPPRRK